MSDILPVFYSHSSQKSQLVWWKEKECVEGGPRSIISIAKSLGLKQIFFVSNHFYDYVEAVRNCEEAGIQLVFGLEVFMTMDSENHSEESLKSNHKIYVVAKNAAAYKDLTKLYTKWKTTETNKYYTYRFDYKQLKACWTNNLKIVLPFFDSPLANNAVVFEAGIIPDFPTDNVTILREQDSRHPYEMIINGALDEFNKEKKYKEQKSKTIYYENRKDLKSWIVYRSILKRSNFGKPELPFACSDSFCAESYKELITQ